MVRQPLPPSLHESPRLGELMTGGDSPSRKRPKYWPWQDEGYGNVQFGSAGDSRL